MNKGTAEPTRPHRPRGRDTGTLNRLDGGPGQPRRCAVVLNERNEIVLTLGPSSVAIPRHSVRLTPDEARRLASDLLAFAGALDGSCGE